MKANATLIVAVNALALSVLGATAHGAITDHFTDDFSDNAIGPQWTYVKDDVALLALNETNQQLQVTGNNGNLSTDAIYLSNGASGFSVSTHHDFAIQIDYHFSQPTVASSPNAVALDLGVGTDATGDDSLAVGYGYASVLLGQTPVVTSGMALGSRVVGSPDVATFTPKLGTPTVSGTLKISYVTATDTFTLSDADGSVTRQGFVGAWGNPDSLLVSFGARGGGFTFDGTTANLDNFVLTPEPSGCAVLVIAALGLLRQRRYGR